MKQMIPFIALIFGTFVLAVGVNLAIVVIRPDLFGKNIQAVTPADSLKAGGRDSLSLAERDSSGRLLDSLRLEATKLEQEKSLADSIAQMRELLAFETARARDLQEQVTVQEQRVDSVSSKKRKDFAKMIETMSAEDAARVLQNLDDEELRAVLTTIKKKQAGKIISAMDARRVAQVMN
jgi:flagellar motility protein MotE (MotC chaperone)